MTTAIDVRLAVQALERQSRDVTLAAVAGFLELPVPQVERWVVALLRRGELKLATTQEYVKVKGVVPEIMRKPDETRIRKLFGGVRFQ